MSNQQKMEIKETPFEIVEEELEYFSTALTHAVWDIEDEPKNEKFIRTLNVITAKRNELLAKWKKLTGEK